MGIEWDALADPEVVEVDEDGEAGTCVGDLDEFADTYSPGA